MKKRAIVFVTLLALVVALLATPLTSASAASFTSSKAAFKVGSTTYKIGTTSTTWKSKLGKYSRKTYDACTAGTTSYMYTFSGKGVKVETLMKNSTKKETAISVIITGKTVGTSAGLKVGAKLSKMTSLYGTGYSKSGSSYTYSSGGKKMIVKFSGDKVKSITLMQ